MIIDFTRIIESQHDLDRDIFLKHNTNYSDTFVERKLALLVELGELANEVRSFKYWSLKNKSADEVIIEEYADGLHFISGFCVQYSVQAIFSLKDDLVVIQDKHMINKKFNKLFKMISDLKGNKDKKNIKLISAIYKKYVALGINLGFNIEQIKEAYFTKHEVNIKRQENKY